MFPLDRQPPEGQTVGAFEYCPVMDFKLELVGVPVSDVDRAKDFYVEQAGFVLDHDHTVADDVRFVQLTPPGSASQRRRRSYSK